MYPRFTGVPYLTVEAAWAAYLATEPAAIEGTWMGNYCQFCGMCRNVWALASLRHGPQLSQAYSVDYNSFAHVGCPYGPEAFLPDAQFAIDEVPCSGEPSETNPYCQLVKGQPNPAAVGRPDCDTSLSCDGVANPLTGSVYQEDTDYSLPGSPLLTVTRSYTSALSSSAFSLIPGWCTSFDYGLSDEGSGQVSLYRPDGRVATFVNGTSATDNGTLTQTTDGAGTPTGWTYTASNGQVETYAINGRIQSVATPYYGTLHFDYGSRTWPLRVRDDNGRALAFTYANGDWGPLTAIQLPNGQSITYTYTNARALSSASIAGTPVYRYAYGESLSGNPIPERYLTSVKGSTGDTLRTFAYDAQGRVTASAQPATGRLLSFAYGATANTVSTEAGIMQTLAATTLNGIPKLTTRSVTCPEGPCAAPTTRTYDTRGNLTSYLAPNNTLTCVSYDSVRNLPLKQVEYLPATANCTASLANPPTTAPVRTTSYQWHPSLHLLSKVVGPSRLQTFSYDGAGRLTAYTAQATSGNGTGSEGFSVSLTGPVVGGTLAYDTAGRLVTVTGPRGDLTRYAYDTASNVTSVTDPVGEVTQFTQYDAEGRVLQMTRPNGSAVAYQYDNLGQLTTRTEGGEVTTLAYDARNLLASTQWPSGARQVYTYDGSQRFITVTDKDGQQSQQFLNASGGLLGLTTWDAAGIAVRQLNQTLDSLNRALTITGAHAVAPLNGLRVPEGD